MKISLNLEAQRLNKSLKFIDEMTKAQIKKSMEALAKSVMIKAQELAHQKLNSTLPDYLNGLSLEKEEDQHSVVYKLSLAPEAGWIETGGPSAGFDLKPGILQGPRKLHISKEGKRYKHVPFEHHPHGKTESRGVAGQVQKSLKSSIEKYGLNKIVKASGNKALQGKMKNEMKGEIRSRLHPYLQGLTQYKKQYNKTTQSTYKTFRTISENSPENSWIIQKPWLGAKIFPELGTYVKEEMATILKIIL